MNKTVCLSRGCFIDVSDKNAIQCIARSSCNKLDVINWLEDVPVSAYIPDFVEVRFKNSRKSFYKNLNRILLRKGDIVAVEAATGHDIGVISLAGDLVYEQMKKYNFDYEKSEAKKIYRKAKSTDIEKWNEAISLELNTMIRSRQMASSLKLNMKIGDVEYQGDKTKAIFYYIADERVDFRELIKVFAEEFRVRIEMKQIGARQEAGRIGGIGACGRELCCATWMSNFVSVSTNAARVQEISLNPQKLAGQCSKLKCCLNFEADVYIDARKDFPRNYDTLETQEGTIYAQKTDIFRKIFWYSHNKESLIGMFPLSLEKVCEILKLNSQGIKPQLEPDAGKNNAKPDYARFTDVVGQESLTRFDKKPQRRKKRNIRIRGRNNETRN